MLYKIYNKGEAKIIKILKILNVLPLSFEIEFFHFPLIDRIPQPHFRNSENFRSQKITCLRSPGGLMKARLVPQVVVGTLTSTPQSKYNPIEV